MVLPAGFGILPHGHIKGFSMSSKTLPTPSENISTFSYPIRFLFHSPSYYHDFFHFSSVLS